MPSISDSTIQKTIRQVGLSGKTKTLTDGSGRGVGRLKLIVRKMSDRAVAEWYAQQWKDGRRTLVKMGVYPTLPLADARKRFAADFSDVIHAGTSIKLAEELKPGTVADLFSGYVQHLQANGKRSWVDVKPSLDKAAEHIGKNKLARDVKTEDVLGYLRPIFLRDSHSMADHARGYIRAAFSWGIKTESDYRTTGTIRRFKIDTNPADNIPTAEKVAGNRWLRPDEFREVYDWLGDPDSTVTRHYMTAIRLIMLLGQRVTEITQLTAAHWNSAEQTLDWAKTKNGRPHCIPVPPIAAKLLDSLTPNRHGLFFPSALDESKPVEGEALYCVLWRVRDRMTVDAFTLRDLRRTWKTLAGHAGLTKTERDLMQNHARSDVSSKHYDRYEYLPEKRAAMAKWGEWLETTLAPKGQREAA